MHLELEDASVALEMEYGGYIGCRVQGLGFMVEIHAH